MSIRSFLTSTSFEAGKVLMKHFGRIHHIKEKKNAGIVTEADKNAEEVILKKISRFYPQSSIITEESGEFEGNAEWTWIIDPLDGTTNYASGFPWFCVSIAAYHLGKPYAGIVHQPVSKETFYAEVGRGAFLNGKRIRVSKTSRLQDSLLGTGFYYSKGTVLREQMEYFRRLNEKVRGVRRPGAAAIDLAFVACGRYDGFWERGLASWDVAAGMILVTEAGGKVSNYKGKATSIYSSEIVASNPKIHKKMLAYLR